MAIGMKPDEVIEVKWAKPQEAIDLIMAADEKMIEPSKKAIFIDAINGSLRN